MSGTQRNLGLFALMFGLIVLVGFIQSWSVALAILNLCLISSIMALGVNIQWGYAGLFNVGIMGFAALGGVAGIFVSMPPVTEGWQAGGSGILIALGIALITIFSTIFIYKSNIQPRIIRNAIMGIVIIIGFFAMRFFLDPAVALIEAINPAQTGYLGGLGLPIIFSWMLGGFFAAGAAWVVGKISLGLRSDYLAIATLGISEIIIAVLKNEDWLTRGVKNVSGLPRPVPYEIDLQKEEWFINLANSFGFNLIDFSGMFVKISYAALFTIVLLCILWLSEKALHSPWGRMMRAIRDNEVSASAMGKKVTWRHLQVFVIGSAVVGVAGAMLTTFDGQFTPTSYQPLRFTFLIWVMVIVGGSGNNWGSVLGGFVIWFFWVEAEPIGLWLMDVITSGMAEDNALRIHLLESAAHMRLMTMGLVLILVVRFTPRGLIPEKVGRSH